ncbi:MAG: flagellar export protein FliJ [Treponema sp.]|jgi:flagellar FliJ protein|nr:flagellar export protein FliJ [Treponema sp.]
MRKFKFKLEKLLDIRKFREEECLLALGQAISVLNKIENDIKETAVKKHNAALRRFEDTDEITAWENYIERLDMETVYLTEQAANAEIIVEQKRALYLEAQRKLEAMVSLKKTEQKEYRKEVMDYQMSEVDDITSARWGLDI